MAGIWDSITSAFSSGVDATKKAAQSAASAVTGTPEAPQPDTSLNTGVTTAAGRKHRKGGGIADTAASFGGRKHRKSSRKAGKKGGSLADTAASFGGRKHRKTRKSRKGGKY